MQDLEISFSDPPPLRTFMLADHERLTRTLAELWGALEHAPVTPALTEAWLAFERSLLTHMEAEEKLLFPSLEEHHAATLHTLRLEHLRLRALIHTPGLVEDLRRLRGPEGRELVVLLSVHARREDECLYQHAAAELSDDAQRALVRRLHAIW